MAMMMMMLIIKAGRMFGSRARGLGGSLLVCECLKVVHENGIMLLKRAGVCKFRKKKKDRFQFIANNFRTSASCASDLLLLCMHLVRCGDSRLRLIPSLLCPCLHSSLSDAIDKRLNLAMILAWSIPIHDVDTLISDAFRKFLPDNACRMHGSGRIMSADPTHVAALTRNNALLDGRLRGVHGDHDAAQPAVHQLRVDVPLREVEQQVERRGCEALRADAGHVDVALGDRGDASKAEKIV